VEAERVIVWIVGWVGGWVLEVVCNRICFPSMSYAFFHTLAVRIPLEKAAKKNKRPYGVKLQKK
jgi:hypothetical protein